MARAIEAFDTKNFEQSLEQADFDEEVRKEEKWEGSTVTIGEARKKLGITIAKHP